MVRETSLLSFPNLKKKFRGYRIPARLHVVSSLKKIIQKKIQTEDYDKKNLKEWLNQM